MTTPSSEPVKSVPHFESTQVAAEFWDEHSPLDFTEHFTVFEIAPDESVSREP